MAPIEACLYKLGISSAGHSMLLEKGQLVHYIGQTRVGAWVTRGRRLQYVARSATMKLSWSMPALISDPSVFR